MLSNPSRSRDPPSDNNDTKILWDALNAPDLVGRPRSPGPGVFSNLVPNPISRLLCSITTRHRQTIKVIVTRNDLEPERDEDGGSRCMCGLRKRGPEAPRSS